MTASGSALLTLKQEQELGHRIQNGDESAINTLVEANLRFALYIANRYRRQDIDMDDLIQEANIGLMLAARHYDPDRGSRFSSYAGWWIEAQLRRFLGRVAPVIRVGEQTRQLASRLKRTEERLLQENESVTLDMVARETGVDVAAAAFALGNASAAPLSLDRSIGDAAGEFTLQDTVADTTTDMAFDHAEVEAILGPALASLNGRQRKIIRMRFKDGRTCAEIAVNLGLSGSRVQQIEIQAIRALRRNLLITRPGIAQLAA